MANKRLKIGFLKLSQAFSGSIERSTFTMASSLSALLLFWQWRPIQLVVWNFENSIVVFMLDLVFFSGWILAVYSTFMINHFHLFGLRQVYFYFNKREISPIIFKIRGPYKYVRYPILLGYLIGFWSAARMTFGHLLFSTTMSFLIIIGIYLKDREFLRTDSKKFMAYKRRVNTIIPLPWKK
jgi:protein-S-isoprenylcysteine O-methyltransferase Ste14